jgi:hypothetical protein
LAPGESTRIAVVDWERRARGQQTEAVSQKDKLDMDTQMQRSIAEVTNAVSRETQEGSSTVSNDSSSDQEASNESNSFSLGGLNWGLAANFGASSSSARNKSVATNVSRTSGTRNLSARTNRDITGTTHQQANAARNRRAAVVCETSEAEKETLSTRVVTNYNHMHALSVQYYEVIQNYRVVTRTTDYQRLLFVPASASLKLPASAKKTKKRAVDVDGLEIVCRNPWGYDTKDAATREVRLPLDARLKKITLTFNDGSIGWHRRKNSNEHDYEAMTFITTMGNEVAKLGEAFVQRGKAPQIIECDVPLRQVQTLALGKPVNSGDSSAWSPFMHYGNIKQNGEYDIAHFDLEFVSSSGETLSLRITPFTDDESISPFASYTKNKNYFYLWGKSLAHFHLAPKEQPVESVSDDTKLALKALYPTACEINSQPEKIARSARLRRIKINAPYTYDQNGQLSSKACPALSFRAYESGKHIEIGKTDPIKPASEWTVIECDLQLERLDSLCVVIAEDRQVINPFFIELETTDADGAARSFSYSLPLPGNKFHFIFGTILVLNFTQCVKNEQQFRDGEVEEPAAATKLAQNLAALAELGPAQQVAALGQLTYKGKPVGQTLDPTPVAVAGDYVGFRWYFEDEADKLDWLLEKRLLRRDFRAWCRKKGYNVPARMNGDISEEMKEAWLDEHDDEPQGDEGREDTLIPMPSTGVFAEAVLGRFNCAEKLDMTRFWKWSDAPIPILPPEISPLQAGSRSAAELITNLKAAGVDAPAIHLHSGPEAISAADSAGQASTAAALQALTASNMFRDMSNMAATANLAQTGIQSAQQGATAAGQQATEGMKISSQQAIQAQQAVADVVKAVAPILIQAAMGGVAGPAGLGATGAMSGAGAALNAAGALDAAKDGGEGDGDGSNQEAVLGSIIGRIMDHAASGNSAGNGSAESPSDESGK